MINKIIILGRLGRDPESRQAKSGTSIANFSVATTYMNNGEEETTWHKVVAFGKKADAICQYLRKGSLVYVEGRLTMRDYEDKQGNPRRAVEIIAAQVKFLDRKDSSTGATSGLSGSTPRDWGQGDNQGQQPPQGSGWGQSGGQSWGGQDNQGGGWGQGGGNGENIPF